MVYGWKWMALVTALQRFLWNGTERLCCLMMLHEDREIQRYDNDAAKWVWVCIYCSWLWKLATNFKTDWKFQSFANNKSYKKKRFLFILHITWGLTGTNYYFVSCLYSSNRLLNIFELPKWPKHAISHRTIKNAFFVSSPSLAISEKKSW